jgi:hypothetical protein
MPCNGYNKFKAGNFNYCSQQWQSDGSMIITIGGKCTTAEIPVYSFQLTGWGTPSETVIAILKGD